MSRLRPASIPEAATYAEEDKAWELGARDAAGKKTGRWTYWREDGSTEREEAWDRNGALQEHHRYAADGALLRTEKYEAGQLSSTVEHDGADKLNSYYRRRGGTLRTTTLHRGAAKAASKAEGKAGGKDRETTYFDAEGKRLFSVRMEEVAEGHVRRYDDGQLVFEGIWDPERPDEPPRKVEYYGADGGVLVEYRSLGGGRGEFRLHRGGAVTALPISDEAERSKYGNWTNLLPGFARYDEARTQRDWDVVLAEVEQQLDQQRFDARLEALPLPAAFAPVCERRGLASVRGAYPGQPIDKLLALALDASDAEADRARETLWSLLVEQDCVFPATYATAQALAELVPLTEGEPRRRALHLLAEILRLPDLMHDDPERYAEAIEAARAVVPELEAYAVTADEPHAHLALQALAVLRAPSLLLARLSDPTAPIGTRAFAACAAVSRRELSAEERADTRARLRQAFLVDPDPGVRVILGALLRFTGSADGAADDDGEAGAKLEEQIDAELVHYLLRPTEQHQLHEAWRPVIRFLGDDVGSTLLRAIPAEVRLAHIERVVDALPARGSLDQAEDLDIIFATLFPEGAEQALTPLHRKALELVAGVVDQHPGFVNHGELFRKHGLPWDSFALRELSRREAPPVEATA